MSVNIKIKYLPGSPQLEILDKGDWIDLYTYEDVSLKPGESARINLGVAMKLPDGYEAHVAPRSSTFKRWGILQTNSVAVIDNSYCGDDDLWLYPVFATQPVVIPKGTRLCQFRIVEKQPKINFITVDKLGEENRGGFGEGTAYLDKNKS